MTPPKPKPIDRMEFLSARLAYLAQMRSEGLTEEQMIAACNLDSVFHVRLLLDTWDDIQDPGRHRR